MCLRRPQSIKNRLLVWPLNFAIMLYEHWCKGTKYIGNAPNKFCSVRNAQLKNRFSLIMITFKQIILTEVVVTTTFISLLLLKKMLFVCYLII